MGRRITPGERMPFFRYDTPYSTQNSFRTLLAQSAPLVLVFFSNFGHPVTRSFLLRYAKTIRALTGGSLAAVVRSRPDKLAASIRENTLPFPLLCDADGVLYEYLDIPQKAGTLMTCSLEAWKILRDARKQGYHPSKNAPQQMPLTLILDGAGTVLFCHYGASLTDVPEDCAAMEKLLVALDAAVEPEDNADETESDYDEVDIDEDDAGAYDDPADAPDAPGYGGEEGAGWGGEPEPEQTLTNLPPLRGVGTAGFEPPAEVGKQPPVRAAATPQKAAAPARAARPLRTHVHTGAAQGGAPDEEDTTEFPPHGKKQSLGPARGYPKPLPGYNYTAFEKTMELGYFNDPYADE